MSRPNVAAIAQDTMIAYNLPMTKSRIAAFTLGCLLTAGGMMLAQPREDVSPLRHPNLAAAQQLCRQAYQKIVDAEQANESGLRGHAERAKHLLDQVDHELKEAAEAANHRR